MIAALIGTPILLLAAHGTALTAKGEDVKRMIAGRIEVEIREVDRTSSFRINGDLDLTSAICVHFFSDE